MTNPQTERIAPPRETPLLNSVSQAVGAYLAAMSECREPATVRNARHEMERWERWCQGRALGELGGAGAQFTRYWAWRVGQSKPGGWHTLASCHRKFWVWCINTDRATASPVRIPFLPKRRTTERCPADEGEFQKWLRPSYPMKPRAMAEQAVVELLASSGCRIGEVCRLEIQNTNLIRREAQVRVKGGQIGTIRFDQKTAETIAAWLDQGRPKLATEESGNFIFLTSYGRKWNPVDAS
jgi:integrase/recombinase XerC